MAEDELVTELSRLVNEFDDEKLYNTTSELHQLNHDLIAFYVDPKEVYEDARTCFSYYENKFIDRGLIRIYFTPENSDPPVIHFDIKAGLRNDYKTYNDNVAFHEKAVKTIGHYKDEIKKMKKKKEDDERKETQEHKTVPSKEKKSTVEFRKENEIIDASIKGANDALQQYLYARQSHSLAVSTVDFKLYETLNNELDKKDVNLLGSKETLFNVELYPGNSIVANYDVLTKSGERAKVFTVIKTDYPIDETSQSFKNDSMKIRIVLYLASLGYYCNYHFVPMELNDTKVFFVLNVDFRKPDEATCKKWAKAYHDGAFQELYDSVQQLIAKTFQPDPTSKLPSFETPLSEKEFKKIYSSTEKNEEDKKVKPKGTKKNSKIPETPPSPSSHLQPVQIETLDVPFSKPTILQLLRVSPAIFWTLLQDENKNTYVYVFNTQKKHQPKVVEVNLKQLCLFEGQVYGLNSDNRVCHIDSETYRISPYALTFNSIISSTHHFIGVVQNVAEYDITHIVLYRGNLMNPMAVLSSEKGYYKTSSMVCEYTSLEWVADLLPNVVDVYENDTHVYLLFPPYVIKYDNATSAFTRSAYKIVDVKRNESSDAAEVRKYKLRQSASWFLNYPTRELQWQQYNDDNFNFTKINKIKAEIATLKDSKQRNAAQEADLTRLVQKLYEMTGKDKPPEEEERKIQYILDEHTVVDGTVNDFKNFDDDTGNLSLQALKSKCGQFTQKRFFTLQTQLQNYIDKYDEAKMGKGKSGQQYIQLLLSNITDKSYREAVRKALEEHMKVKDVSVKVEPSPQDNPVKSEYKTDESLPPQYYINLYDTQKEQRANGQFVRGYSAEIRITKIPDPVYRKEVEQALQEHKAKLERSQLQKDQVKKEEGEESLPTNDIKKKTFKFKNSYELKTEPLLQDINSLLQKFKPIKIESTSTDREKKEKLNSIHDNLSLYRSALESTNRIPDETLSKISELINELKSVAPKKGGGRFDEQGHAHYFDHETRCLYECYFHNNQLLFKRVPFPISLFKPRVHHVRNVVPKNSNMLNDQDFLKLKENKVIDAVPAKQENFSSFFESKDRVQREKQIKKIVNELGEKGVINDNVLHAFRSEKSEKEKAELINEAKKNYLKAFAEGKHSDKTYEEEKRLVDEYFHLLSQSLHAIETKNDDDVLNLNRVRTHLSRDYESLKGRFIRYVQTPPPLTQVLKDLLATNKTKLVHTFTPEQRTDMTKAMEDLGKEIQRKVYELHDIDKETVKINPNSPLITTTQEILSFMRDHSFDKFLNHFQDLFDAEKISKAKPLDIGQSKGLLSDIHIKLQGTNQYFKTFLKLRKERLKIHEEKKVIKNLWDTRTEFYNEAKKMKRVDNLAKQKETKKIKENEKQSAKDQIKEEVGESKVDKNSLLTNLAIFFGNPTDEEDIKYKETLLLPLFKAKYKDHATRMITLKNEWTKFIANKNLQRIKVETKVPKATKKLKTTESKSEAQKLTFEYKFLAYSSPQTKSENKEGKGKGTRKQAVRGRAATVPLSLAYLFCNEDPCYITERVENMLVPYEEGLKLEKATNVSTKETTKIKQDLAAIIKNPNVLKAYVILKYSKTTKEGLLLDEENVFVPSNHPLDLSQDLLQTKKTMLRRKIIFREELLYFVQLFQCNYDPAQSKSVYAFFPEGTQPPKQKLDDLVTLAIGKAFHTKLHDAMVALRKELDQQKTTMTFTDKVNLFLLECDKYNRILKALQEHEDQFQMEETFGTFDSDEVISKLNHVFKGINNAKRYILATYYRGNQKDTPKDWETNFFEKEFPSAWLPLVNKVVKEVFKQFKKFKEVTY